MFNISPIFVVYRRPNMHIYDRILAVEMEEKIAKHGGDVKFTSSPFICKRLIKWFVTDINKCSDAFVTCYVIQYCNYRYQIP